MIVEIPGVFAMLNFRAVSVLRILNRAIEVHGKKQLTLEREIGDYELL